MPTPTQVLLETSLQSVLHRDSVPFALYPVSKYSEVQQLCKDIFSGGEQVSGLKQLTTILTVIAYHVMQFGWIQRFDITSHLQELQTLILINCGATEDIAKLLDITSNIRVIVIDSHRPFHHNLNDGNTNFMAFCNPADGTCDDVPEADLFSGKASLSIGGLDF